MNIRYSIRLCPVWARFIGIAYHSIFCNRLVPISIAAVPQTVSTPNLPGSETTLLSLSWYISYIIYGFITLVDKQSNSTLESESVAAVAMLNNALAGRNRSASDVSRFRLSSRCLYTAQHCCVQHCCAQQCCMQQCCTQHCCAQQCRMRNYL